jgi:tetratricopeptide (TPR) repeat protein
MKSSLRLIFFRPIFLRSIFAFNLVLFSLLPVYAQTSESELKLGIAAYKASRFEKAIWYFQKAVDLDPSNIRARMYLATAYVSQYIPGVDTKENIHIAEQAIEQYQYVLDSDTEEPEQKLNSAKGLGYIYLNMKKFDDAKKYYRIAADLAPDDPEPYYSIAVIDWTLCYQPRMEARAKLNMPPAELLSPKEPEQKKTCDELRAKNMATIEEGMDNLNKAIQLRPDYDDAMAYMNLMYRERADLECDNATAREEDLKTADHWVDETLRVKKMKAEKSNASAPPTAQNP